MSIIAGRKTVRMRKIGEVMKNVGRSLVRSFGEFPVVALLGLTFYVFYILNHLDVEVFGRGFGEPLNLFFPPIAVQAFCLQRLAGRTGRLGWSVLSWVSYTLWIPVWLFVEKPGGTETVVVYLLAIIFLFAVLPLRDNEKYARSLLHTVIKGAAAVFVCLIIEGLLCAIIGSVELLFLGGDIPGECYTYPVTFINIVILPLLCCTFISEDLMDLRGMRFIKVIVEYLLSPAIVVYTVILYLYILKVLFMWELPEGGVAYLVGAFVAIALMSRLLRELVEETGLFDWFYKAFPYIALAPLVLLWVGAFRRVGEYGLTEARVFLLAGAFLLTLFDLMLISEKTRSFALMSFLLGFFAVILTFIPGIRAVDFGVRSQRSRLESVLPKLLVDGHLPDEVPYRKILEDPELEKEWRTASGAWRYLGYEMPREEFDAAYGVYGSMKFASWRLEDERSRRDSNVFGFEGKRISYRLGVPVDVGPYTKLMSEDNYYCYEDASVVVFYADSSREKELLRCNIVETLDACRAAPDSLSQPLSDIRAAADSAVLVYKNDRYLAVFDYICDCRPDTTAFITFSTGRKTLFARP